MGLNAYFAYTVVIGMGYPWQAALAAVFVEGLIFIVLSVFNVREAIFNSIPMNLKKAVSVGIGFFIAFIGLQNAKIVVGGATLVQLFSLDAVEGATMNDAGICVLLAIIGVFITAILVLKEVKGNILWGILITWLLGIICQFTGLYVPNAEIGYYSLLPDFSAGLSVPSLAPIFMKLDFTAIPIAEFVVIIFAFLFVDIFDTLGTLIGVASKADMLDEEGRLPRIKGALMADAVATTDGYFHHNHFCGECIRSYRRRKNRSDFHDHGDSVPAVSAAVPGVPGYSVLRNCSGTDHRRILHGKSGRSDRFYRLCRRHPGIHLYRSNAVLLQHL